MSGANGQDEAARLEAALLRIARAAAARIARKASDNASDNTQRELHPPSAHATTPDVAAEVATRLDALIADIRSVLGTPVS